MFSGLRFQGSLRHAFCSSASIRIRPVPIWKYICLLSLMAASASLIAQNPQRLLHASLELPDAPTSQLQQENAGGSQSTPAAGANTADMGSITGTVEDTNHDVIQGARVTLSSEDGKEYLKISGNDGEFSFSELPPGSYTLRVTGGGWGVYSQTSIHLLAGESKLLSGVVLPVSNTVTEVRVDGSPQALSEQQVQIAIHQRVLSVFPNFYSSFDWNAPPMLSRQKYALAFRSMIDPMTFLGAGVIAGVEQARDTFPGYGQGSAGYGRRYGAAYANSFTGRMLGGAVFPSLFHQDPRYFYKGSGSVFSRALYALSTALITKADDGSWQPNYSHVLGNFTAGAISNLYYPPSSRGLSLTLINGALETAGDAGTDFVREFFLRGMTSHVPSNPGSNP